MTVRCMILITLNAFVLYQRIPNFLYLVFTKLLDINDATHRNRGGRARLQKYAMWFGATTN